MHVAIITGPTIVGALNRINLANKKNYGVELRLDLFHKISVEDIKILMKACNGNVILTCSDKINENFLFKLLELNPTYIDFNYYIDHSILKRIYTEYSNCKIISSYYNFEITPNNLDHILQKIQNPFAHVYKIYTTANSISDSYRMLLFIQKCNKNNIKIVGLCMGENGQITREDGLKSGNYLNYTILNQYEHCTSNPIFV